MSGDDARRLALGFPEAAEKETVKASKAAQAALVGSEPETFSVPAYVGQHGKAHDAS